MLGRSFSLFGPSPYEQLKDTFLLYKKVTEQYKDQEVLRTVRSLIPQDIVLQTRQDDWNIIVPLLRWFKNDFMKWAPKGPACEKCANSSDSRSNAIQRSCNDGRVGVAPPIMQIKKIIPGNSWKMRKLELFICSTCKYEHAFPRYGEILRIAETRTGRCSEWSMLFGAMLSSIGIKTRIVHDFLDHCWNEAMLSYPQGPQWVHLDSTLDYPVSLNHPYYYEVNWAKEYEYILAFTADKVQDVTQRYTLKWKAIQQRRLKKKMVIDFPKVYSSIKC